MIRLYSFSFHFPEGVNHHDYEHEFSLKLLYSLLLKERMIQEGYDAFLLAYRKKEHGKPYLDGYEALHFNISHCPGKIAIAFGNVPLGVDVERIHEVSKGMMKKILNENELQRLEDSQDIYQNFFRYWTLKESYLKWTGEGFFLDPKRVEFSFEEEKITCSDERVCCLQKKLGDEYFIALTYSKENKVEEISYEFYEEEMDRFDCKLPD